MREQITDLATLDSILYIVYSAQIYAAQDLPTEKAQRLANARRQMGWTNFQQIMLDCGPDVATSTAAAKVFARLRTSGKGKDKDAARTIFSAVLVSDTVREEMLRRHGQDPAPPVPQVADVVAAGKGKKCYHYYYPALSLSLLQ